MGSNTIPSISYRLANLPGGYALASRRSRLDNGHSDWVNPKGCQRVAGGRHAFTGRPPGNAVKDVNHPRRGDRTSEPARSGQTGRCWVWHPSRVLTYPTRFSGGRSGTFRNDHRLPSANPPGWWRALSCWRLAARLWTFRLGQPEGLPDGSRRSPWVQGATSGERRKKFQSPRTG
jgi:hypothetical protein